MTWLAPLSSCNERSKGAAHQDIDLAGTVQAKHAACVQSRHFKLWIPMRCEAPGCTNQAQLARCSRCTTVMYCSKECQKKHWKEHKLECAHLAKLGMWGQPYPVPMHDQSCSASAIDAMQPEALKPQDDRCNCCGATGRLEAMECCGLKVCEYNPEEYELCSYSRDFCARSHERYSRCGHHEQQCCEDHKPADWRDWCETAASAPRRQPRAHVTIIICLRRHIHLVDIDSCRVLGSHVLLMLQSKTAAPCYTAPWRHVDSSQTCVGVHAQSQRLMCKNVPGPTSVCVPHRMSTLHQRARCACLRGPSAEARKQLTRS